MTSGRRLAPEVRRAQLVGLGLELVKQRPFDQVLVDDVAREAGISKALLFHHFGSKREFQAEVIRAAAGDLLEAVRPANPDDEPLVQLRQGIEAFVRYVEQQPATYQAVMRRAGSDATLAAVFDDTRDAIIQLMAGLSGAEVPPFVRLGLRGWLASVEETTFLWLQDRPCPRHRLVDLLFNTGVCLLPLLGPGRTPPDA